MSKQRQLTLDTVSVAFDRNLVVRDIGLELAGGEIGCLLGPSGCGKTTLLRAIAGFEPLAGGEIRLGGRTLSRSGFMLPPERRRVGMVFQDFALFPHLTVAQNIAFGLRRMDRAARRARVDELLELVSMQERRNHYPHQISGGQQQRVALARAIAPHPDILLLDEPFSSLDTELREALAGEIRQILKREGITAILVTHDQHEAFAMADTIGVMTDGRLAQWDSGYNLYHQPRDPFVADFIGQGVMLPAELTGDGRLKTPLGLLDGRVPQHCEPGCRMQMLLRPDDVIHDDDSELRFEVLAKAFRGAEYLYTLKIDDRHRMLCLVQSHHVHEIGEKIGVRLEVEHLVVFPDPTQYGAPRPDTQTRE